MPYAPDLAGSALDGRYELHELIGEGTFGRVYRGLDRRLRRPVAIKVIKPWWGEDPDWAERFEREAQLLARVSHPGVVQIHDVGQSEEGLFYVAELVEGESLAARLRRGALAPREAARIGVALCRALDHMHRCGVVHRDIKPANVLLGPRGQVKVGDFSIARLAEGSSDATVAGTPRYMAPEQAHGAPATPRTDLYSAGVVIYEMLAGRPPFGGSAPVEIALHHMTDPPPPLPATVPRDLAVIVGRALAKAPQDRFAGAGAMADALEAAGVSAPVAPAGTAPREDDATRVAPRFGPRQTANPAARRRAVALVAAVAGVVAAMLALAALVGHGGGRPAHRVASVPALVRIPDVSGLSAAAATAALGKLRLAAGVVAVPAPGVAAGTVTAQSPAAGARVTVGARVALRVAEVPRWRTVAVLAGSDADHTPIVRIRGTRWRLVTSMHYVGTCTFIIFCDGPTAHVTSFPAGDATSFDLAKADARVVPMSGGPGQYELSVAPGDDTAAWRIEVQDHY
jgi:serine/threonine-protein kinase